MKALGGDAAVVLAERAARMQGFSCPRMALVVGGYPNQVVGPLTAQPAGVGIVVAEHWEQEHRKALPVIVDLVLVLTDVCSSESRRHAKEIASRCEVTIVEVPHKWAAMARVLVAHRLVKQEQLGRLVPADAPVIQQESKVSDKPPQGRSLPDLRVTPITDSHEERVKALRALVADLFDKDGFRSIIATADTAGKVSIEVERVERRLL